MDNCIFCQIAAGRIPSIRIYEDKDFIAFMDINPLTNGHCLLISREHYPTSTETPDDLLKKALPTAKKIAKAMLEGLGASGYNFLQNNGEVAGQMVAHWHMHIIPRKEKAEMPQKLGAPADLTRLPFVAEEIRTKLP